MASKFLYSSTPALRRNDSGFALPIAIGVGLFLIIVAASIILRSQQQQVTAIAQKQTASSLSAAEVGVSRIQNLLANYRAASLYSACANLSGDTCDAGSISSLTWKNASDIPGLPETCPKDGSTSPVDLVSDAATKDWQRIDPRDATKGEYRLLDYRYVFTKRGEPDGVGTLKVQGRAGTASGSSSAVTQLTVTIPVQKISPYVPGLWVNTSVNTGMIGAHVLGPCTGTINATSESGFVVARSGLPMPDAPGRPTNDSEVNKLGSSIPADAVLPQRGDTKLKTGIYQYVVKEINNSFTITPGEKVEIWVEGDIKLQGGQKIQHQCGSVSGCSPFDAKIYGLSSSGTIELKGDAAVCDVFFHAPTYKVELKDSVKAANCGKDTEGRDINNNGIYWVDSWNGGGRDGQVALDQTTAVWSSQPTAVWSGQPIIQPLTALKPITGWQREEAESPQL
jgi:hypothetical protein